ncbi:MAG TPA: S1/P1 nuclease [Polyangia bacterium]|nr:S1/P1 nuclease [Polyangia bacterium]
MDGRRGGLGVVVSVLWTLALPARPALAWDDFGHMEVAAIAFAALKPAARARIAGLLKLNPRYDVWTAHVKKADHARIAFLRAATWADAIKSDRAYKDDDPSAAAGTIVGYGDLQRHKMWHYVDHPFSPDGTPTVEPTPPNAATQIALFRAGLCDPQTSEPLKSYQLVWLLHLVADVHQPLHAVSRFDRALPGGDRGGNLVKITGNRAPVICDDPRYCPFGPPTELHAFFDDVLGAGYATAPAEQAAAALPRASAKQAAISDEKAWIDESYALAVRAIYVAPVAAGSGPFVLDDAYQKSALALAKKQVALAGARLANLLNACLAP